MEDNMMEYMAESIQYELENTDIIVEYDGNKWFIFDGNYVRVMAEVYSEYDTFNFGAINFSNSDHFYSGDDTESALRELKTIFDIIDDNDGVTVLM